MVEIFGIIAGCILLISFAMPKQIYIRSVGVVGCAFFVVYGVLLTAWSLWIINSIMILIHLFYIVKIIRENRKKTKEVSEEKNP